MPRRLFRAPTVATLAAGIVAVAVGMAVMALGGAPRAYLLVNAGALVIGLGIASALSFVPLDWRWPSLAAALALLATALWGVELDGIQRWAMIGSLRIQPSLLLLPTLLCGYARSPDDVLLAAGMVIAAIAMALQPDWSMTFALAMAGCTVLVGLHNCVTLSVASAALMSFAVALFRNDDLPPVRYVEKVIVDGLIAGGPAIGGLIVISIAALVAPMLLADRLAGGQQRTLVVFVQVWLALLVASVIGPYPTPLLGYGASAIIGYFAAVAMLRRSTGSATEDVP